MKLTSESKFFLGILGATLFIVVAAVMLLSKPASALPRQELLPAATNIKGNPNAPVYLVEFSDFQCPACKAVKPVVDALVTAWADKLVFGYRHFPLPQHPLAQPAALAAEAAGRQGKFWEMYDFLFANQEQLSSEVIRQGAQQLQLNLDQFQADMDDPVLKDKVTKDAADGTRFGVNSTPTFFLNGRKLELSSFADLANQVQQALKQ